MEDNLSWLDRAEGYFKRVIDEHHKGDATEPRTKTILNAVMGLKKIRHVRMELGEGKSSPSSMPTAPKPFSLDAGHSTISVSRNKY